MDQALVEGQAVEEGFERGARRALGPHHVHVAEAFLVGEVGRAGVGAHFEGRVIHHQRRHRDPCRQRAEAVGEQQFDGLLGLRVEGGVDARAAGGGFLQAFGQ